MKIRLCGQLLLLVTAFFLTGCASLKPPLDRDESYPADWPDIVTCGVECLELDGTYLNEGVVGGLTSDQEQVAISLTSILPIPEEFKNAKTVSLKVRTKEVRPDGDSFAKLEITVDDHPNIFIAENCACTDQTFFYAEASDEYIVPFIPLLVTGGSGKSVWFTKAKDGSLIVKAWGHDWAFWAVVPYFHQDYIWVRFEPLSE